MTNTQRTKNDNATTDRRDMADKLIKDNRIKNDEQTMERRARADRVTEDNRMKNDEMTDHRREINDINPGRAFMIFLLVLIVLAVGIYFAIR